MGMTAHDRVGPMIDEPARQFTLALAYPGRVFLSPMHEHQNERSLPPRFRDRSRGSISIESALALRIVERDHRGVCARSRLKNHRLGAADDRNIVRPQAA